MSRKTVLTVVGARPNFMKAAPVYGALTKSGNFRSVLVHTGQHYDPLMSEVFFTDLGLPQPEFSLGVGSGSHAEQTARVMMELEPVLLQVRPDLVIVVGDVNSTAAAALTAAKLSIPVAHVEAGLRSFDRTMPEEINRIVADSVSDILFPPSQDAVENLLREGKSASTVHFVGNVMIDSLNLCLGRASRSQVLQEQGLEPRTYLLATLHRPGNVDRPEELSMALQVLASASRIEPLVWVLHPRTAGRLEALASSRSMDLAGIRFMEPLGYLDFLQVMKNATAVLTDSGGIQEETTVLGVPCITLRESTERPITVTEGTNVVTGLREEMVLAALQRARSADRTPRQLKLWDGRTADRIVDVIRTALR